MIWPSLAEAMDEGHCGLPMGEVIPRRRRASYRRRHRSIAVGRSRGRRWRTSSGRTKLGLRKSGAELRQGGAKVQPKRSTFRSPAGSAFPPSLWMARRIRSSPVRKGKADEYVGEHFMRQELVLRTTPRCSLLVTASCCGLRPQSAMGSAHDFADAILTVRGWTAEA
jgi:hypothetical protein